MHPALANRFMEYELFDQTHVYPTRGGADEQQDGWVEGYLHWKLAKNKEDDRMSARKMRETLAALARSRGGR